MYRKERKHGSKYKVMHGVEGKLWRPKVRAINELLC